MSGHCIVPLLLLLFVAPGFERAACGKMKYSVIPVKWESEYSADYVSAETMVFGKGENGDIIINATYMVIKTFPLETRTKIDLQKENLAVYRNIAPSMERNICDFFQNDKMIYPEIMKHGNFPKTCPLDPREYRIINFKVPLSALPPVILPGNYKVKVQHATPDELLFKGELFGQIVSA